MDIIKDFIPLGANRPGRAILPTHITVHETGNAAAGANARMHNRYIKTAAVSWHYTVDDKEVIQHLPDTEMAYHAGTRDGNISSIGIEICINADGDFEKAKKNAQALIRELMYSHRIPISRVVQHNFWNGKDCPHLLRSEPGAWERFKEGIFDVSEPVSDWAADAQAWVIESGISDGKDPKAAVTREQVWTMLYRMRKREG